MTDAPATNRLPPTNEDTVGPYFPILLDDPALHDLSRPLRGISQRPAGQPIRLTGRVLDRHGGLANGVVMEFWQANARGVYRTPATAGHPDLDPWFDGWGRIRTPTGAFDYRTILPGPAPGRAPCLTITLFSDGISRVVTQMFFAGHPANATDPLLAALPEDDRARLLARPDGQEVDGTPVWRFDIVMAGDGETPFFDDMES